MNANNKNTLWITIIVLIYEYSIFFYGDLRRISWVFISLILIIVLISKKENIFNNKFIFILLSVYALIFIQALLYGGISIAALYKPLMIFLIPFLMIKIQKEKFLVNLFNGIYILSVLSTVIFFLYTLVRPIGIFIDYLFYFLAPFSGNGVPDSIIVFSVPDKPQFSDLIWTRNAGFSHEPGAFAVIILLGIILNSILTRNIFERKNLILSFIMLTTFSTAGYAGLSLYFGYFLWRAKIHSLIKILTIPIIISLVFYTYNNNDFMNYKIESSFNSDIYAVESGQTMQRGRFFAFIKAAEVFISNPITGRGILTATETDIVDERASFGYGFMGLLANYGIIFGSFYLLFFFRGFKIAFNIYGFSKKDAVVGFLSINLLLLTQPFFLSIPFVLFFLFGYFSNRKTIIEDSIKL